MNASETMHVLLFDEDYAVTSWATDACGAVESHFADLDLYCSPSSDIDTEERLVTVYSIPLVLEDSLVENFEHMESDAVAKATLRLDEKHPEITKATVKFSYKSGELHAVCPI